MSDPIYIFFRKAGWYPIQLKDDDDARANAELNPGTVKVELAETGRQVWPLPRPLRSQP